MARVVTIIAKFGLAVVLVVIAVMLLRRGGLGPLSDAWGRHKCAGRVQADLNNAVPHLTPRVGSCEGPPTNATCQLETDEEGGTRSAPVTGWDCSRRHLPEAMTKMVGAMMFDPTAGPPKDLEQKFKTQGERFRQFYAGYEYVTGKLKERAAQIQQGKPAR